MDTSLPDTVDFKTLTFFLSIAPPKVSTDKHVKLVVINLILLLLEAVMQYVLRREIFAYVDKPVLMVLDCVAIMGPLIAHFLQILESLMKRKTDATIWSQILTMNDKTGASSSSLGAIFYKDFVVMSTVPLLFEIAVLLATFRTQKNWTLGLVFRVYSGATNRFCILAFVYYWRYMSDRFSSMAQEIDQLHGLTKISKCAGCMIAGRLNEMKRRFNMIWCFHGLVKNRYEVFLVSYVFLSLCGLTGSAYFLGTRLVTRRFSYAFESSLNIGPYVYVNIHLSVVAADFLSKQAKLLEALQQLSEKSWGSPQVLSAIKSFRIQLQLANLVPTVGGHLRVDYATMVLGVNYIATTYIFIFLFLN